MTATHSFVRWFWLPLEVGVGFLLSGFLAWALLSEFVSRPEPAVGFLAAVAVVITTYVRAPKHRLAAGFSFVLGAIAAYFLLRNATFQENHPRGYEQTYVPLWATLSGGAAVLVACAVHALRTATPFNNSLERKP